MVSVPQVPSADSAAWAFSALGPEAQLALPELTFILKNGKGQSVRRAASILGYDEVSGWPTLLGVLTNAQAELGEEVWSLMLLVPRLQALDPRFLL